MPRTDIHLDSMLRHLGAAYYESLHGRATGTDVTRALDTVEEHLGEHSRRQSAGGPGGAAAVTSDHRNGRGTEFPRKPRGRSHRVSDVMTRSVVTVDRITPYKEVARLLAGHRISGVPVLKMGREVIGVVTEADLLEAQANVVRRLRSAARPSWWPGGWRHPALTAGDLMTSPAVTISPDATIPAAVRLMNTHHVRRLPVTGAHGALVGIVSRRDLISVFLRPDEDIAADARRVIDDILLAEPGEAGVTVHDGIMTLTGTLDPGTGAHGDLIPVARQLMWDIDGVVDIVDQLGEPRSAPPERGPEGREPTAPETAAPSQSVRPATAGRKEQEEST